MQVGLKVWRFNSRSGERELQEFEISAPEEATLLDCLDIVKDKHDGTLAYRKSCRMMICGSCGMRMDGAAVLACKVRMYEIAEAGHVPVISAMGNLPIVKDLVVDMEPFWEKFKSVNPYLQPGYDEPPDGKEYRVKQERMNVIHKEALCINCGCCVSECNAMESDPNFLGPQALAKGMRFVGDPRDGAKLARLEKLNGEHGIWECTRCYFCNERCPKGVDPRDAIAKLGAHALYLNTAFAGPQLTEVVRREKPVAIIYDEEFTDLLKEAARRRRRFVAWHDAGRAETGDPTIGALIETGPDELPSPPERHGRVIILTSGTTGTPKGVSRSLPDSIDPAVALLSRLPLRAGQVTHVAAPLFHSWGLAHFTLGMLLNSTLSLTRKFDPESTLAEIERSRGEALVVVPVMMQRILGLPAETRRRYDTSSLRVVAASGSALPGDLATKWMDEFGDGLYNLYGSTEVAWATIATPEDMRVAPGTAGRAPRGTVVKIYDEDGRELPPEETGRIFVGNDVLFEGYTGGGSKSMIDGLMATGDVGRMGAAGRLFVEGRDDEMIVSGGENVFPQEIEDLLASHPGVAEVAATGVSDDKFGQRLLAFVVPAQSAKPSEDELKRFVKENLASYKVPRQILFLEELPRNATGKVLKRELADPSR